MVALKATGPLIYDIFMCTLGANYFRRKSGLAGRHSPFYYFQRGAAHLCYHRAVRFDIVCADLLADLLAPLVKNRGNRTCDDQLRVRIAFHAFVERRRGCTLGIPLAPAHGS